MSMTTSQILMFVDPPKTQKSTYLEHDTLFFIQIKKFINYILTSMMWQKVISWQR